jgi:hypothetical protein
MKTTVRLSAGLGLTLATCLYAATPSQIQILSATVRDQSIAGATVILQKNGEQSSATTTDSKGAAQVAESVANDPSVLLIVRKAGYSDLVAKCPCGGFTYALSPTMQKLDGMRIVLNWGETPRDLDGHLVFPGNHVWFRKQQGQDADLDVDHVDGFGPETITISRKHAGERYTYAVQDYSDKVDPATTHLSQSDAKVFVYIGQTLIRTYYVPKGRAGNVWTVFTVSEAGEFQDINSMSGISVLGADDVTAEAVFGLGFGSADRLTTPLLPAPPAFIPAGAHKLNVEGEAAYKAGDYLNAIRLFQSAIDEANSYGQAYSNLGLVFQKSGRVAEALWANRKAIALASGPQASTTRASTHFNNGRIYEEAGQFGDALREYLAAQAEKANPVYDNAVTRMRERGVN